MRPWLVVTLGLSGSLLGCTPPVPAPEGLDESASFLVREFHGGDATFEAGLQGFLAWFEDEGRGLLELEGDLDEVGEFQLQSLQQEDVQRLPTHHGRAVQDAAGVVALALMDCTLQEAEDIMLRPDQDAVFEDWEGYSRQYVGSRERFQAAWEGDPMALPAGVVPYDDDFEPADVDGAFLSTINQADPSPVTLVGDFPAYPLHLEFRHGRYELQRGPTDVFAILTYMPDAVQGPQGTNHLHQNYAIEINAELAPGETLRALAVWLEGRSEAVDIEPDNPLVLRSALTKSRRSSQRMSEVCAGEFALPQER